jgi:aspartyl-tRNA(Asn)/glutamyl-tRNA(Gln) amidotransferase subunit C
MNIAHLLKLARLKVKPAEAAALAEDLERIVEYVGQLGSVDTSRVEPMAGGTDLVNISRADEERIDSFKEENLLLESAPQREDNYFKVPRILE